MNISFYLFGDFGSGYTQYPDDYSKSVFEVFHRHSKATTQIAIHRAGDLMYYGYVRELEGNDYLGMCVVVNGVVITQVNPLFDVFEGAVESMVRNGYLIHFNDKGEIAANAGQLYENREEIDRVTASVKVAFERLDATSKRLPPVNYGAAQDAVQSFSIQDDEAAIVRSSFSQGYTFVYKSRNYNTAQMNSYKGVIQRKNKEIEALNGRVSDLNSKVAELKYKQRNTKWVAILALIAIVLFGVVYVKVINPREVTKKDMGEFVYYGPMQDGNPNGVGVAIYHEDDSVGRLYYYGNFSNGERRDTNAIMFYKDGSYFKGEMQEDQWVKGLFFDVEKEHFVGEFSDNEPCNGDWYKHVKVQTIVNGR